jgi:hypothetical protein
MKLDPKKYTLYRLSDSRLVAIDEENQKVLDHCISIWNELAKVPVDRTVRGVFVIKENGELMSEEKTAQQNDLTINQLRSVSE